MSQAYLSGLEPEYSCSAELSQWYTPRELAERIVGWARVARGYRVLEPAAGRGALIEPLRPLLEERAIEVVAVEIDPANVEHLRERFAGLPVEVVHADFLSVDPWRLTEARCGARFDLALENPPYEGDRDAAFVARSMELARRTVALLRSAFRHGAHRQRTVWRHALLVRVAELVQRPQFDGPVIGSALSDFAVFELMRRGGLERYDGAEDRARVEWW